MSWETRERGGRYYTRTRKVGGRTVREYVGTGYVAELASRIDALERERREDEWAVLGMERSRIAEEEAPVLALHRSVDVVTRGALLAASFYRHHGQWRRRRAQA